MPSAANLFRDVSRAGPHAQITLAQNKRYAIRRLSELTPAGLAHAISSVELSQKTSEGDQASLYLFLGSSSKVNNWDYQHSIPYAMLNARSPIPFVQDFHGDFLRLTLPSSSGSFTIDDLRTRQFNDKTSSVMLVDRWKNGKPEKTISARSTFTLGWNGFFLAAIPIIQFIVGGVAISRIQDPLFTWAAFPTSPNLTDSDIYLVASQWFVFHASGIGMNVWLQLYLRFSVSSGRLVINVVDMDRYVWPGTGQGQMYQALDGNKGSIISGLQTASTALLQTDPLHIACDDVYLLPGTQPDSKATVNESSLGDALDDVTIVLENPRLPF
jgi:hypothetical protein